MQRAIGIMLRPVDRQIGLLAVAILCLNIFDAYASLYFVLRLNEREMNPMLAWLMNHDPESFVWSKILVSATCAFALVAVNNTKPYWRKVVWAIFWLYLLNALYLGGSLAAIWVIVSQSW